MSATANPAPQRHQLTWAVAVGDVLIHRYPTREGAPGKRRPCLVVGIRSDQGVPTQLILAYGGDAALQANRGFEISASREPDFTRAGLRKPTRFTLARRVTVPMSDPCFDLGPEGTPVIGRLSPELLQRLQDLLPRLDLDLDQPGGPPPRRRSRGCHVQKRHRQEAVSANSTKLQLRLKRPGTDQAGSYSERE